MADILVELVREDSDGFFFEVTVRDAGSSSRHRVTLRRHDYQELAWGIGPEVFIRRCFEFLLQREPKESILSSFDVRDISRYFPEFRRTVAGS
jgi:hypothetical protein